MTIRRGGVVLADRQLLAEPLELEERRVLLAGGRVVELARLEAQREPAPRSPSPHDPVCAPQRRQDEA